MLPGNSSWTQIYRYINTEECMQQATEEWIEHYTGCILTCSSFWLGFAMHSLGSAIFRVLPSFCAFFPCFHDLATLPPSYNSFPSSYIYFFLYPKRYIYCITHFFGELNPPFKINYANTFGRIINVSVSSVIMHFA